MINTPNDSEIFPMTKPELVSWIKDDITIGGSLAIEIPDKEIDRVIDQAVREARELYPDALQQGMMLLHRDVFAHPEFRANRTLQFPECVTAIIKFEESRLGMGLSGLGMGFAQDIGIEKVFMADAFFGGGYGLVSSDVLASRMISMSAYDQLRSFSLRSIGFSYNRNTHRMLVTGHDPKCNVLCQVWAAVPERDLFDDPWVRKWCSAKCKLQVYKLLGTFQASLLAGVSINANVFKEDADSAMQACEDYWKGLRTNPARFIDFY